MSKLETPMIHWYWNQIGGTLIEEFQAVKRSESTGQRLIDAVILPDGPKEKSHWREVSIQGRDIICIQAKRGRLGMYLMGQTLFSAALLKRMGARSVKSIALCERDDAVLHPLLMTYEGMEIALYTGDSSA